jgi:hypothetical protein
MLLHSCCCIFIYELSGFYRIQKGVQNLLKMNLQNCFIKEKGKHLFFSLISLDLAHWPNQPPPSRFRRPKRALPLLSLGLAKWPARPSSWASPQTKPQASVRSLFAWPADTRGPRPPSLPCGATTSVVSYLPLGWPGGFPFLATTVNRAIRSFLSY